MFRIFILALAVPLFFAVPANALTYQGGKCIQGCPTDAELDADRRAEYLEHCGILIPANVDPWAVPYRACESAGDTEKDQGDDDKR